jgi:hypothetical protein
MKKKNEPLWYSLDSSIAEFTIPLLKQLIEKRVGFPHELTDKKWNKILNKILHSMECAKTNYWNEKTGKYYSNDEMEKVQEGLNLFAKHFTKLWD